MARFNIMPFISPLGGTYETRWAPVTAAQTFDIGEPVGLVAAGTLSGAPEDTSEIVLADFAATGTSQPIWGIAASGPGTASSTADPSARVNTNWRTGAAYATAAAIPFWPADQGNLFIARLASDTGAAYVAPAVTDIGETYRIVYGTAGTPDVGWCVEQTAATVGTDCLALVTDVLDTNRISLIHNPNGTGVWVVVELKSRQ
jgi:hypothetical protein